MTAKELANKLATDAMLRQGDPVTTIECALKALQNETLEECAKICEAAGTGVKVNGKFRCHGKDYSSCHHFDAAMIRAAKTQ